MKSISPNRSGSGSEEVTASDGKEVKAPTGAGRGVQEEYVLPISEWQFEGWRQEIQELPPGREENRQRSAITLHARHYEPNGSAACSPAFSGQMAEPAVEPEGVAVG
jgi:hypothetical protein